jgi:anti-sigma factor RsiW
MIQLFTQEMLIRYVYNDLPDRDRRDLEAAFRHDPELAAECAELLQLQATLSGLRLEPSARTTDAILAAARHR